MGGTKRKRENNNRSDRKKNEKRQRQNKKSRAQQLAKGELNQSTETRNRRKKTERQKEVNRLITRIKRNSATEDDKQRYLELTGKPSIDHLQVETKAARKRRLNKDRERRLNKDRMKGRKEAKLPYRRSVRNTASEGSKTKALKRTGKPGLDHGQEVEANAEQERRLRTQRACHQKKIKRKRTRTQMLEEKRLYRRIKINKATEQEKQQYLALTGRPDLSHIKNETKAERLVREEKNSLSTRIRRNIASEREKRRYLELTGLKDLSNITFEPDSTKQKRLRRKNKCGIKARQKQQEQRGKSPARRSPSLTFSAEAENPSTDATSGGDDDDDESTSSDTSSSSSSVSSSSSASSCSSSSSTSSSSSSSSASSSDEAMSDDEADGRAAQTPIPEIAISAAFPDEAVSAPMPNEGTGESNQGSCIVM